MKTVRRFILAPALGRLVMRDRGINSQVVEGYFSAQPKRPHFVRLQPDECHLVVSRVGPNGEQIEEGARIPQPHAEVLLGGCAGHLTYEQIRLPNPGNGNVRLDRVIGASDLYLLTAEFEDQQQAEAFDPPVWLGPEVTGQDHYERRFIALNGLPQVAEVPLSNVQLESILDLLDQSAAVEKTENADDRASGPSRPQGHPVPANGVDKNRSAPRFEVEIERAKEHRTRPAQSA